MSARAGHLRVSNESALRLHDSSEHLLRGPAEAMAASWRPPHTQGADKRDCATWQAVPGTLGMGGNSASQELETTVGEHEDAIFPNACSRNKSHRAS